MKSTENKYIVREKNTNPIKYLHLGGVFYKTTDIKEASVFKSKENAQTKIIKDGIHYIIKYEIIKI